ncbi:S-methyl thiohydantoin desulfurase domain-containing protein [Streptomyces nodosus]
MRSRPGTPTPDSGADRPRLPGPAGSRTHGRRPAPCGRCARRTTARAPQPRARRWRPRVGHLGGELAAVDVIEIGGLNAVAAVLAAARLGAPVLDGDLMGRASPGSTGPPSPATRAAPPALVGPGAGTVIVPASSRRPWPKPTAAP